MQAAGRLGCWLSVRAQAEEKDSEGFAEEAVDRLPVFEFNAVAKGGETALRSCDGIHDGVQCEFRLQIGAEGAIGNTFAD